MGLVQNAKNLYIVDDRDSLKKYMNDGAKYWIRAGYTPSLEEVIRDIMTNEDAITQTREEAMQAANKEWLEMLSVYEVANNIVNLVSFNLRDSFDESKRRGKSMKLTIKESRTLKESRCSLADRIAEIVGLRGFWTRQDEFVEDMEDAGMYVDDCNYEYADICDTEDSEEYCTVYFNRGGNSFTVSKIKCWDEDGNVFWYDESDLDECAICESADTSTSVFDFVVNFSPIQDLAYKYKCNYILSSPKQSGQNSVTFDCETTNKSKADKYITALDKAMQKKGYSCHILTKRDNGFRVIVDKNKNESLRRRRRIQEGFDVADDLQDIWDFVQEQKYDSAATSQNQLAGGVKAVVEKNLLEPGTINLDYGGGRYDKAVEYLKQFDVMNLVFDPFNRKKEHNKEVLDIISEAGGADSCTCCNVLNVIDGDDAKITALRNMNRLVKSGGMIYIQTYKGPDGSGVGKETTKGWQENKKTQLYLPLVQKVFPDAKIQKIGKITMIVCQA